jgi:hypothetical protein
MRVPLVVRVAWRLTIFLALFSFGGVLLWQGIQQWRLVAILYQAREERLEQLAGVEQELASLEDKRKRGRTGRYPGEIAVWFVPSSEPQPPEDFANEQSWFMIR